ncbi:MAG: SDR family oxidoreductase [Rhodanobacter sp.]
MNKKVVIITGAGNGFGKLAAIEFSRRGHAVYATMRDIAGRNKSSRDELLEAARSGGHDLHVVEMDVTDETSVQTAVDDIADRAGRIDTLINNAGVMYVGVTEAFTLEQVKHQFNVNFFGSVRANRAVLPYMRSARSGLIIHVSSLGGRAVFPFFSIYCASKFALEALAEAYHYELSGLGVDSVIVEPGPFPSNLLPTSPAPADHARLGGYSEQTKLSVQLKGGFDQMFKSSNPPRPQLVVDAFINLVESTEKRPLRTVVMPEGLDFGIERMNQAIAPIQNDLLGALGLSNMV